MTTYTKEEARELKRKVEAENGMTFREQLAAKDAEIERLKAALALEQQKCKEIVEHECTIADETGWVCSFITECKDNAVEIERYRARLSAVEQLNVCYRIGKRPSEKLLKQLDKTNIALKGVVK